MTCPNLPFLPSFQWRFTFSHFVVEPGQEYEVTIHHLPKPIPDGDPNHQSRNFPVPGKGAIPSPSLHHMLCGRNQRVAQTSASLLSWTMAAIVSMWYPQNKQMPGIGNPSVCGLNLYSLKAEALLRLFSVGTNSGYWPKTPGVLWELEFLPI